MKCCLLAFIVLFLFFPRYSYEQNYQPPVVYESIHVVQKGETLYSISRKFNISIGDLKKWNGLTEDALYVGQRLQVSFSTYAYVQPPPLMEYRLSQQYADSIMYARVWVQNNCLFNVSGELQYHITPAYRYTGNWRERVSQFYNTPAELDNYLRLFRELNTILVKRILDNEDRKRIRRTYEAIRSFERDKLAFRNREGRFEDGSNQDMYPASWRPPDVYSTSSPGTISVNILAVRASNLQPLPNSKVYAVKNYGRSNYAYVDLSCLESDCRSCDFAQTRITSDYLANGPFYPDTYQLLVTLQQAGIEHIVFCGKQPITKADDGKTFKLPIAGY